MDKFSTYYDIKAKIWTVALAFVHLLHSAALISTYCDIMGQKMENMPKLPGIKSGSREVVPCAFLGLLPHFPTGTTIIHAEIPIPRMLKFARKNSCQMAGIEENFSLLRQGSTPFCPLHYAFCPVKGRA